MEKGNRDPDQANFAGMIGAFIQKLLKYKTRLGWYLTTGSVAVQLIVNPVLFSGFSFLCLILTKIFWPKIQICSTVVTLLSPTLLPTPQIFKMLESWRPPEGYLCPPLVMGIPVGHTVKGPVSGGLFLLNFIWPHYALVTRLYVVSLCLATFILAFFSQVHGQPTDRPVYDCVLLGWFIL